MIIEDDTKQTLKFIAWLIGILVLLYLVFLLVFYKASAPERNETHQLNQIALQKSPITKIERNYHLNRGVNSYSALGQAKDRSKYYFIYLPGTKKAYLLSADKGVSEKNVARQYTTSRPTDKIVEVNLGWYKNKAVWEVTAKNSNGNYRYQLYEFKNGNLLG